MASAGEARSIGVIGVPTDVGAADRGACMGPEALRVAGLREAADERGDLVAGDAAADADEDVHSVGGRIGGRGHGCVPGDRVIT